MPTGLRYLAAAAALLLIVWALYPVWLAILLAVLLYLMLEPLVARMQARQVPQTRAIALALLPPLLILGWAATWGFNALRGYLPQLPTDLAYLQTGAVRALQDIETFLSSSIPINAPLSAQLAAIDMQAAINLDQLLASSSLVAQLAVNFALVPPLAFFILRDFHSVRDRCINLLPNPHFELGWLIYNRVSNRLQAYLRGLLLQQLILASITAAGFWLAGFPSPILLGLLTGIAGLVPYLGPLLAMIAPLVIVLGDTTMANSNIWEAVLVLAVGFGFDNLVVIPFLLAGSVNIHPAVALVAVVIAGHFAGIPGMILVIPLLGMARIITESIYHGLRPATVASR